MRIIHLQPSVGTTHMASAMISMEPHIQKTWTQKRERVGTGR